RNPDAEGSLSGRNPSVCWLGLYSFRYWNQLVHRQPTIVCIDEKTILKPWKTRLRPLARAISTDLDHLRRKSWPRENSPVGLRSSQAGLPIGKATAELFAEEGAKVVLGDLASSEGEQVANTIGATFVATDVGEAKSVENLVRRACDEFGGLDVMFNNAGIGVTVPLLDTRDEDYFNTIRIDLDGVYWGLKYGGKVMVEQKR